MGKCLFLSLSLLTFIYPVALRFPQPLPVILSSRSAVPATATCNYVIPAQAGIQSCGSLNSASRLWIPGQARDDEGGGRDGAN